MASKWYDPSSGWNVSEVESMGYRVGSIIRVKMRNFLTYEECEVFPGPRLNVVLGPNGTGKSAMTHAICLACGGVPTSVGRSPDLTQFVRRGSEGQESYAEVDILKSPSQVVSVRRIINMETKGSKWQVNKRQSTQRDVKEIMRAMNIDVDNLCSFMAQDKVGSFSQANPREILHMTLESIVNSEGKKLSEEQKELSSVESTKLARQRERDARQAQVETLQTELDGMTAEVERMQARGQKKELLDLYKIKEKVVRVREHKAAMEAAQAEVDEAQAALDVAKEALHPLETQRRELERKIVERQKSTNNITTKLRTAAEAVEDVKESIESAGSDLSSVLQKKKCHDKDKQTAEKNYINAKANHEKVQDELNRLQQSVPDIERGIARAKDELKEYVRVCDEIDENLYQVDQAKEPHLAEDKLVQRLLSQLKDPKALYKRRLQAMGRYDHVLKAMKFVEDNEDHFRGPVYGPLGMYVQCDDHMVQQCLEAHIGFSMGLTFVCTNEDDEKFLKRNLWTNRGGRVQISVMNNEPQVNMPYSDGLLSQFKKDFGYAGSMLSYCSMPDVVRGHLLAWRQLDAVLIAKGASASESIDDHHIASALKAFPKGCIVYTIAPNKEINQFNGSMSKYDKNSKPIISRKGVSLKKELACSVSDSGGSNEKEELEARRAAASDALKILDAKLNGLRKKKADASKEKSNCQALVKKLTGDLNKPKSLKNQVSRLKSSLADAMERIRDLESDKHLENIRSKLADAVNAEIAHFNALDREIEKYYEAYLRKEVMSICSGDLEHAVEEVKRQLELKKRELDDFKSTLDTKRKTRAEAKRYYDEANEVLEDLEREHGEEKFLEMYTVVASQCPEDDLSAIELRMEALGREIDAAIDNPAILLRYENTQAELENAQKDLTVATRDFDAANSTMEARSHDWKKSVRNLVQKMDILFSHFMEDLNFRGNLSLKGVSTIDKYEMCLKVAFRENEPLSELSGQQHSGGERAVSTIMYLMALQGMTASPFRVVDEVNQGMDERNERLVFDRIVQSCCGHREKPQYFLVSPKLLQGLRSMQHDDVTVLLVWNGPGISKKWHFHRAVEGQLERLKERGLDVEQLKKAHEAKLKRRSCDIEGAMTPLGDRDVNAATSGSNKVQRVR
mgnify:CR=1 FL=1